MAMEPPVDCKKPSERSMSSSSSASSNRKKARRIRRGNRTSTGSGSNSGDITPQSGTKSSSSSRDRHRSSSRQRAPNRQHIFKSSNESEKAEKRQSKYQQSAETSDKTVFVVATDTGHERMRKVSILSLHDPMDNKNSEENDTLLTACSSPKFDETSTSNGSAHADEPKRNQEDENSYVLDDLQSTSGRNDDDDDHAQRPKILKEEPKNEVQNQECGSHDRLLFRPSASGNFVPPKALHSDETLRRRRTRSLDDNECLVELEFRAPDMHQSTQTDGFTSAIIGEEGMDVRPERQADQDATKPIREQIHRRGMEVRGIISPTSKQKQLMRRVSALGMEDPVFGNISEQVNPRHASNIFDDMDFADVPDDMKDMLTLASDRTDVVGLDDDILDSPQRKTKDSPRGSAAMQESTPWVSAAFHNSCSSLPPLGLAPEVPTNGRKGGAVGASPSVQFQRTTTTQIPPRSTNGGKAADTNTGNCFPNAPPSHVLKKPYVPPEGSFNNKKRPGKNRSNSSSVLLHDEHLAAQIDALFQNSMPVLNTNCLHNSASSLNDSFNTTKSNEYNRAYVPPLSPMQGCKSTKAPKHRVLPSVDSIFPSSSGQNDKRGTTTRPRESRKGAAMRSVPRSTVKIGGAPAQRGHEHRSKSVETDRSMEMDNAGHGKSSENVVYIPPDVKIGCYEPSSKVSGQSDFAIKGSPPSPSKTHGQKPAASKSKGAATMATKVAKGSGVSGGKVARAIANKLAEGNGFPQG